MIHEQILQKLTLITKEEQLILNGSASIDKTLYMEHSGTEIQATKLLETGKLITIRPHTRFIHFPKHTHDYVEVVYMCQGTTTHIINGKEIMLREGELLFLGQTVQQEILEAGKEDIAVNFIIVPQFFNRSLEMIGEEETLLRRFLVACLGKGCDTSGYLHFKVADILPIQNLVENLLWTLIYDTRNKRQINQTTMGLLFMMLLNHTDRLVHESLETVATVQLMRYIEENYQNGSLTEAAQVLHYDLCWLSREVKRKTGKTYTELLQEKRLSQAAYFLKHTKMKISDIAEAVGYSNTSYFYRLFKAQFGILPREYRLYK